MGAHVSKVLSLTIDTWPREMLAHVRTLGNAVVNAELEASLPPGVKPDSATCSPSDLEAFIRAKYELGSFREGGDGKLAEVAESALGESEAARSAVAKAMAEFCGLLIIRLLRATDLPPMNLVGSTDAFVEFALGERRAASKVVKGSLQPVWQQTLSLNVRSLSESLILKLFDKKTLGGQEFIGQALIPLADLPHDGQPMGLDLTLDRADPRAKNGDGRGRGFTLVKKGTGAPPKVALELTYNALDR